MWGKKDQRPFPGSKISINPSYEWSEDAKALNVSHRELEVFALLMDGQDNRQIAQILGIQYQSVKNHTSNLYKKLKAKNMAEAMKLLLFGNFITVEVPGIRGKFDRERWIRDTKWVLEDPEGRVPASYRKEIEKFLMDSGIYGKLYADRLEELKEDKDRET